MKTIFKSSFGFTMVGTLVASSIGAIAVIGLARLSSNIINTLNKSRKETNLMELSQDIKKAFQAGYDPNCDTNDPSTKCFNTCTSSLIGFSTTSGGSIYIKAPDPLPNPSPLPPGISAGDVVYKGGGIYKGIRIQDIRYEPSPIPNRADVTVHFSISDDTRETLTAPRGLHFKIFIDEISSGNIERCSVASATIVGSGAIGVVKECRNVDMNKTLVGCGGTSEINDFNVTAFGYRAGRDKQNATGGTGSENTFLGTEAGRKNIGSENIFIGYQAGLENKEGEGNLFLGYKAGKNNTKGIYNVVIGKEMEVPDGAEKRDRLNIADVITGTFRNRYIDLSSPAPTPKAATPSMPEVTIKGPVQIDPPPYATTAEPGLFLLGEMHIEKKQSSPNPPKVKIKAEANGTPADEYPLMTLKADSLIIQRPATTTPVSLEVRDSVADPRLVIGGYLKIFGAKTADGGIEPALDSRGYLHLRRNEHGVDPIDIQTISGPKLQISGDLTVKGKGGGANSRISGDLKIGRNFYVEGQGILDNLELQADTDPTKDGTAKFGKLQVDGVATIPQIEIGTGDFKTTIAGISKAGIGNLDGGDGHRSHIHPSGPAALKQDRTPNHNHDCQYSRPGHSHPNPGCGGGGTCGEVALCSGCPSPDRVCTCACSCPACCPSSRTLKRNIKAFKDYKKSLKNIADTPLFTYRYKKNKGDHPEKLRMGIISEELPKDLQIMVKSGSEATCETDKKQKDLQAKKNGGKSEGTKTLDSRLRGNDKQHGKDGSVKSGEKISTPDWLSIYGTLWAGIKAFAKQLEDFKKENSAKLTELSKELKAHLADQIAVLKKEVTSQLKSLKSQTAEVEKAIAKHSKKVIKDTKELSELKKQFEKNILPLQKNLQEDLKKTRKEMDTAKEQFKQNLSFHPAKKPSLEARSQ